jgi:hypothetical protein
MVLNTWNNAEHAPLAPLLEAVQPLIYLFFQKAQK